MARHLLISAVASGLGLFSFTAGVMAQGLPASVSACRSEPDDVKRVRCYDRAVDRLQTAAPAATAATAGMPPAPGGAAATAPPGSPVAPSAPSATLAEEPRRQSTAARVPMFKAMITAIRFRSAGEFVVTLDNGQVWTQYVAQGKPPLKVGDTVTIRPGWLGSYLLVTSGEWITKVHPLQNAGP